MSVTTTNTEDSKLLASVRDALFVYNKQAQLKADVRVDKSVLHFKDVLIQKIQALHESRKNQSNCVICGREEIQSLQPGGVYCFRHTNANNKNVQKWLAKITTEGSVVREEQILGDYQWDHVPSHYGVLERIANSLKLMEGHEAEKAHITAVATYNQALEEGTGKTLAKLRLIGSVDKLLKLRAEADICLGCGEDIPNRSRDYCATGCNARTRKSLIVDSKHPYKIRLVPCGV